MPRPRKPKDPTLSYVHGNGRDGRVNWAACINDKVLMEELERYNALLASIREVLNTELNKNIKPEDVMPFLTLFTKEERETLFHINEGDWALMRLFYT